MSMTTVPELREMRETHPWLTFGLDLERSGPHLWLALGEAKALLDTLGGMPVLPEVQEELYSVYLARGALATVAIEGNTLTEEQARAQVRGSLHLPSSQEYLAQEIQNVIDACDDIKRRLVEHGVAKLSPERIEEFNGEVLQGGIPLADGAVPGRFRRPGEDVVVSGVGYRGLPGRYVRQAMSHLCEWLSSSDFHTDRADLEIPFAILKSIVAHLYIAWIHPFGDGNGRTARLVEYYLLLCAGAPDVAAHLLSDHYNKTRADYYRQLARSSQSGGNPIPFCAYAARGFADGLKEQIEFIKAQQLEIVFGGHVRDVLRDMSPDRTERQRTLVMALAERWPKPAARSEIRYLTPALAKMYAHTTEKTVTRDLTTLTDKNLITHERRGQVKANLDAIKAFLPARF